MYKINSERGFTVRNQEYNGISLTAIIDTTQYRILSFCDGIRLVKPSASISLTLVGIDLYQLTVNGLL